MQKKEQKKTQLGFWEYDYDTDLLQWSDEIYTIFECDPGEFTPTNQAFFDLVHPEDREKVLKAHTEQELNHQEFDVNFRIITDNGKIKYLNEQAIIKFDAAGKPVRSMGTVINITEQRETESALEESRRLLTDIIENSNTLIYTKDLDGRYLTVNRKWEEVIGKNRDLVLGNTAREIFGEEIYQEFSTNESPVYREGKVITIEETFHFCGQTRYFINTAFPLRDSDGAISGLCGTSIEITDRKENEKALVASENMLRNLLNSQTNYMVRTDMEGKHTYWNRIFEENFDFLYARQGIGGGDSLLSICDYHHERTRETVAKCLASPGKIFQVELDKPTREGGICTTLWEFVCLTDEKGMPYEIQCMGIDITDHKRTQEALAISESRFNQVAKDSRTVIWEMDAKGMYTYVSDAAEDVWGYTPSEVIGKLYFFDMHPNSGKDSFRDFGKNLLLNAIPLTNYYNPIQRKDGRIVWVSTSEQPFYDNDGHFSGFRGSDTDVTEKKLAEDELLKFRTIADQAIYGNAIADMNGTIVYLNKTYAEMHGWQMDELLGQSISVLHKDDEKEAINDLLKQVRTTGGIPPSEVWRKRKNGSTFLSSTTAQLIPGDKNESSLIWAVVMDITSSKNAEEKIKQQNQRLNAIVTAVPDLIFIINTDGIIEEYHISDFSKAAVPAEQITGTKLSALFDKETADQHLKNIRLCLERKELISYEYYLDINGTRTYFESRIVAIDEFRVLAFVRDITARKNSEYEIFELNTRLEQKIDERTMELARTNENLTREIEERKKIEEALKIKTDELEKFFSVSLDLLCISNTAGYFIKLNKAWETMLGYELSYMENSKYIDFVHPDDVNATLQANERLLLQKSVFSFTNRFRTKTGTYKYLEWYAVPVGELVYSAARDITGKIQIAQSLQENIAKEKELNELKSRFVSTASHEFKTPLASIQMSAETLLSYWQKMDEEKITEKLQGINSQVKHLTSIVTNVMQVAKIQEGKFTVKTEEVDLVALCKSIVSDFRADISLQFTITEEYAFPSLKMDVDKRLIVQVIQNLISNAIKYSQPGPEILIRLFMHNNQVLLSVKDNGIGIPEADRNNIFEPFFRASNVSQIEGNGLGLNIVRESARMHGGDLTFESTLGKGTVFYVSLPKELMVDNH